MKRTAILIATVALSTAVLAAPATASTSRFPVCVATASQAQQLGTPKTAAGTTCLRHRTLWIPSSWTWVGQPGRPGLVSGEIYVAS